MLPLAPHCAKSLGQSKLAQLIRFIIRDGQPLLSRDALRDAPAHGKARQIEFDCQAHAADDWVAQQRRVIDDPDGGRCGLFDQIVEIELGCLSPTNESGPRRIRSSASSTISRCCVERRTSERHTPRCARRSERSGSRRDLSPSRRTKNGCNPQDLASKRANSDLPVPGLAIR